VKDNKLFFVDKDYIDEIDKQIINSRISELKNYLCDKDIEIFKNYERIHEFDLDIVIFLLDNKIYDILKLYENECECYKDECFCDTENYCCYKCICVYNKIKKLKKKNKFFDKIINKKFYNSPLYIYYNDDYNYDYVLK
jgi:hypothetical protein